jgi:hypothetical protein
MEYKRRYMLPLLKKKWRAKTSCNAANLTQRGYGFLNNKRHKFLKFPKEKRF